MARWSAGEIGELGSTCNALSWIQSYLAGRSQCTTVAGVTSEFADLHAGVPQRAILSPLLFSVFLNDLPQHVPSSDINLFADDTFRLLFRQHLLLPSLSDCVLLSLSALPGLIVGT